MTRRVLITAVAVALFAIPVAAYSAVSLFVDVPDDSIYVNDTNWMKITGVSKGCNPPLNTKYCPESPVLRQEMAAFLHRLSDGEIVNAATAVEAENADTLDGKDADELTSITGSSTVTTFPFTPDPFNPATNPVLITSLIGFDVPAMGGVIQAHANTTAEPNPPGVASQIGFIWIVIDGDGSCPTVVSNPAEVGYYYLPTPLIIDTTSALATAEVPAGATRIDLCTAALGTHPLILNAHLSATWNPVASSAGVGSSEPATTSELLERFAPALDG